MAKCLPHSLKPEPALSALRFSANAKKSALDMAVEALLNQSTSILPSLSAKGILPAAGATVAVPPVTTDAALRADVLAAFLATTAASLAASDEFFADVDVTACAVESVAAASALVTAVSSIAFLVFTAVNKPVVDCVKDAISFSILIITPYENAWCSTTIVCVEIKLEAIVTNVCCTSL